LKRWRARPRISSQTGERAADIYAFVPPILVLMENPNARRQVLFDWPCCRLERDTALKAVIPTRVRTIAQHSRIAENPSAPERIAVTQTNTINAPQLFYAIPFNARRNRGADAGSDVQNPTSVLQAIVFGPMARGASH